MNLVEWTVQYIKHRDIFFKKLISLKEQNRKVIAEFKDKTLHYFVSPVLEPELLPELLKVEFKVIVCSYAMSNLDFVLAHWEKLSAIEELLIIFADPKTGKKLLINPQSHSKIAEPESLKQGLLTMFEAGKE